MAKKVIVVESPTKAKTIKRFIGKEYKTVSSKGHIRDLPKNRLGVNIANNFSPTYVTIKGKGKVIKELKDATKDAKLVILATDPDREGEAIAYHIAQVIKKPTKRALCYEITKEGVLEAINNLVDIDDAKVEAQQARRILDRLVGYRVSPLLWKTVRAGLSAGRVQSVALRLIAEREEEIRKFKPQEYWEIDVKLCAEDKGKPFVAKLVKIDDKVAKIKNEKEATKIEKELRGAQFLVSKYDERERRRNPLPPYTTSTLQQDAALRINFSVQKTMRIAQELYEGVELGKEGSVGLITYMRTDSVRVAEKAIGEARSYIYKNLGTQYLTAKPLRYKEKSTAQAAHEAIRPTKVERTPDKVKQFLTNDQFKLYKLIWQRFVASQITPAIYIMKNLEIEANRYLLKAAAQILKFDGFTRIYKPMHSTLHKGEKEIMGEKDIPKLEVGTALTLIDILKSQHFTKPKPRYTEATMVKELESKGIGRPSTYAPIISTIIERNYVEKRGGKFYITELGEVVNKLLVTHFPDIFNVDFTKAMEERLDEIESRKLNRVSLLTEFYKTFQEDINRFESNRQALKAELIEPTDERCEKCGSPMVMRWGRYGRFIACSNFPKCNFTKPISTGIKCAECNGELIELHTKKGKVFYGCSNYPKCKYAIWNKPINRPCTACGYHFMIQKRNFLECPKCGAKSEGEM